MLLHQEIVTLPTKQEMDFDIIILPILEVESGDINIVRDVVLG
jgi:hypothetical protein